jgi:hypothetical protein
MRFILIGLLALLGGFALDLGSPPFALAADDLVEVDVVPQEIALQPGGDMQRVILIAHASPDWSLKDLRLQIVTAPGVTAHTESPLAASGDFTWNIDITADSNAAKESVVLFRMDYTALPGKTGGPPRTGTVGVTAKVSYAPLTIAQAVKITPHHAFDTLKGDQSGQMLLSIENTGIEPVTLQSIGLLKSARLLKSAEDSKDADESGSDGFTIKPSSPLPLTIPGRDVASAPVTITAPSRISPGTAIVLLDLRFARGAEQGDVSVVDQVPLGIPGLSDLKTVLQIPTLLFMPGVLIVLTWALIWNRRSWGRPASDADPKFPLSAPSPEFWVIAITLSLLVAAAYPWVSGDKFDLLDSVSVTDIGILWFGSIVVVAPVTYVLGTIASNRVRRCVAAREQARRLAANPQDGEKAATLLPKLVQTRHTLRLPAYNVTSGGQQGVVFELGFGEAPDGKRWVTPGIRVTQQSTDSKFAKALETSRNANDAAAFYQLLIDHPGEYLIGWKQVTAYPGPCLIDQTTLGAQQGEQLCVDLQ